MNNRTVFIILGLVIILLGFSGIMLFQVNKEKADAIKQLELIKQQEEAEAKAEEEKRRAEEVAKQKEIEKQKRLDKEKELLAQEAEKKRQLAEQERRTEEIKLAKEREKSIQEEQKRRLKEEEYRREQADRERRKQEEEAKERKQQQEREEMLKRRAEREERQQKLKAEREAEATTARDQRQRRQEQKDRTTEVFMTFRATDPPALRMAHVHKGDRVVIDVQRSGGAFQKLYVGLVPLDYRDTYFDNMSSNRGPREVKGMVGIPIEDHQELVISSALCPNSSFKSAVDSSTGMALCIGTGGANNGGLKRTELSSMSFSVKARIYSDNSWNAKAMVLR